MKETISKRCKKQYAIMLAIAVITFFTTLSFIKIPVIQLVAIPMLVVDVLGALVWSVILIDQRGVIEKSGYEVTLRQGIQKTVVKTTEIINAYQTPHQTKKGEVQKNCVSVEVMTNGKRRTIICADVLDVANAVRRLNEIKGTRSSEDYD